MEASRHQEKSRNPWRKERATCVLYAYETRMSDRRSVQINLQHVSEGFHNPENQNKKLATYF